MFAFALAPHLACSQAVDQPVVAHSLEAALRSLGAASCLPRELRKFAQCFRARRTRAGEPNHLLVELRKSPQALTEQQVAECFAQRRTSDFSLNHIVIADGWVLSRAEAELCELLAAV
jgi:hypothetical protein